MSEPKKVVVIHTVSSTVASIPQLIRQQFGDQIAIDNILDQSLLQDLAGVDKMPTETAARFAAYAVRAQKEGADAVLCACSSIGEAAKQSRKHVNIPVFRIDEPMAQTAADGKRVLVMGTVRSTLEPSRHLIEEYRADDGVVETVLLNVSDNLEEKEKQIASAVRKSGREYDTIVLAQASMAGALKHLEPAGSRVLASLPSGIEQLQTILEGE